MALILYLLLLSSCQCSHQFKVYPSKAMINEPVCSLYRKAAEAANQLALTAHYDSAVVSIKRAWQSAPKEYTVAWGKDVTDRIYNSAVTPGNHNNGYIPSVNNRFADIHIHTGEEPPSSGDIYGFIDQIITDSAYIRFIITPMQQSYALVLVSRAAAIDFNKVYPRSAGVRQVRSDGVVVTYQPTFPPELVDELNRLKSWNHATPETVLVYLLKKYQTGIALLKRNNRGTFTALDILEETGSRGHINYKLIHCTDKK